MRQQLDALGDRRREREADERVEGLVPAVREPVGAGDRVLGERERVEARRFDRDRDVADLTGVEQVALEPRGLGVVEDELHALASVATA